MTDYSEKILEALGDIKAEVGEAKGRLSAIEEHLRKLNGSVARHSEQLNLQGVQLINHAATCPMKDQLRAIQDRMTAEDAANKVKSRIRTAVISGAWMITGAGATALFRWLVP